MVQLIEPFLELLKKILLKPFQSNKIVQQKTAERLAPEIDFVENHSHKIFYFQDLL